jgi:hypothetical protein
LPGNRALPYAAAVFPVTLIHDKARQAGLEYLVIGGHAVNAYGIPRATLDVDFLGRRDDRARWRTLLEAEGFSLFRDDENFMQFAPPYGTEWRLDVMLVNAPTFAKLAAGARSVQCLGVETRVPCAEHLIALKLHALRHGPAHRESKDFLDILTLVRAANLDVNSPALQATFDRYGTPELYERFRKSFEP